MARPIVSINGNIPPSGGDGSRLCDGLDPQHARQISRNDAPHVGDGPAGPIRDLASIDAPEVHQHDPPSLGLALCGGPCKAVHTFRPFPRFTLH